MQKLFTNSGDKIIGYGDFFVIMNKDYDTSNVIPLDCPVCTLLMRYDDDDVCYNRYGCCNECTIQWIEQDPDRWLSGWRPEQNDIDSAVMLRLSLPSCSIV